ncbi:MAG: DUF6569 family protein [bacterium]
MEKEFEEKPFSKGFSSNILFRYNYSMPTLAHFLDGVIVKDGSAYQGLWIFPVCLILPEADTAADEPLTLEEGLKTGGIAVYETGAMDRARIVNQTAQRAVVLDGETLLGGAQNRIVNAGSIIPAGREVELPSSCVEVHRWDCVRDKKNPIPEDKKNFIRCDFGFGSLRRLKMAEAVHSLRSDREVRVDQKKVWEHIVRQFGFSGASTKTLDLHDLYEFWDSAMQLFPPRFPVKRQQVGLIAFQDRDNWFLDLFADRGILYKYVRKIVRGHAFDTLIRIERELIVPASKKPTLDDARSALKSIKLAPAHKFRVGGASAGENMFFATGRLQGAAVLSDDALIHLAACSM